MTEKQERMVLYALLASGVVEAGTCSMLDAAWQVTNALQARDAEVRRLRGLVEEVFRIAAKEMPQFNASLAGIAE